MSPPQALPTSSQRRSASLALAVAGPLRGCSSARPTRRLWRQLGNSDRNFNIIRSLSTRPFPLPFPDGSLNTSYTLFTPAARSEKTAPTRSRRSRAVLKLPKSAPRP